MRNSGSGNSGFRSIFPEFCSGPDSGFVAPGPGILKTLYLRVKTRFDETFCHHKIPPPSRVTIIFWIVTVIKKVKSSEFSTLNPKNYQSEEKIDNWSSFLMILIVLDSSGLIPDSVFRTGEILPEFRVPDSGPDLKKKHKPGCYEATKKDWIQLFNEEAMLNYIIHSCRRLFKITVNSLTKEKDE